MKRETRNAWITVAIIAVFAVALIAIATWTSERYELGTRGAVAGQADDGPLDITDTGTVDEEDDDDLFVNDTESQENVDENQVGSPETGQTNDGLY